MSRCSTDYVARSYTPSLTVPSLWYHTHSIQPSYLRPSSLPYISIVILPTQCSSVLTICPYQFRILSWTSIVISPTFGVSILYLLFLILSTFVTYHIHRSNFFYCAFYNVSTERITRETRDRAGWRRLIRCAARAADHHS